MLQCNLIKKKKSVYADDDVLLMLPKAQTTFNQ